MKLFRKSLERVMLNAVKHLYCVIRGVQRSGRDASLRSA